MPSAGGSTESTPHSVLSAHLSAGYSRHLLLALLRATLFPCACVLQLSLERPARTSALRKGVRAAGASLGPQVKPHTSTITLGRLHRQSRLTAWPGTAWHGMARPTGPRSLSLVLPASCTTMYYPLLPPHLFLMWSWQSCHAPRVTHSAQLRRYSFYMLIVQSASFTIQCVVLTCSIQRSGLPVCGTAFMVPHSTQQCTQRRLRHQYRSGLPPGSVDQCCRNKEPMLVSAASHAAPTHACLDTQPSALHPASVWSRYEPTTQATAALRSGGR